ncbi:hypothetical protein F0562_006956 [Nyssa sinensis]|uniref:PPM-type phosphatase domain-containing protein n=1 Tax=Nyssa sinensis TaxID=561372 RepID=A0A5J5A416_9ASTE|nr:hypothetical protein F0562_006956 [Nyssa sinensis]
MGICISTASSEIHETDGGHENVVYYQETVSGNEIQRLGSLCSQQGSKGSNQDAAILYQVMDKEIKLLENLDCSCSGTTAVIVIKQGGDLVIANLGDSRAVLGTITENGLMAVQLTTDLKPDLPMEADRIKKSNGRVIALKEEPHIQRVWLPHEDTPGLAMSRAFGDFILKNHGIIAIPDVSFRCLTSNDQFLVLATDGVWDVLSNNEVALIVSLAESEEAAARAVIDAAIAAWNKKFPTSTRDDCTVVCLFLQKMQHLLPDKLHCSLDAFIEIAFENHLV